MEENEDNILDLLRQIGFVRKDDSETQIAQGWGISNSYEYHPEYMDNHYTLIIFRLKKYTSVSYRLYIHNSEGRFVSSPFQLSFNQNTIRIKNEINRLFSREIREIKIKNLLDGSEI